MAVFYGNEVASFRASSVNGTNNIEENSLFGAAWA